MRRLTGLLFLGAGLLCGGCSLLQQLLAGAFVQPTLTFKAVNLRDVSLSGLTFEAVYHLDNPNPVGLDLAQVSYALSVEGRSVLSGSPRTGLSIPASGGADLSFPASLRFQDLASVVEVFLSKDFAHYRASGSLGVNTPVGVVTLPLQHEGQFEVPKLPNVQVDAPRVTAMDFEGATLELPLTVTNRNSYALPIQGITGALALAGEEVGELATGDLGALGGRSTRSLTLPVRLRFAGAARALTALRHGSAAVSLRGQVRSGAAAVPFQLTRQLTFAQ